MELKDALDRIHEIRGHLDRTEVFRGYRSVPVAASGLLALAAALLQPRIVPDPTVFPLPWLFLWLGTAALSVAACAAEMIWRHGRTDSPLERERIRRAAGLFLPAVSAGALVTLAAAISVAEALPLLPGLWAILMGIGVFASLPMLPRAVAGVGGFYLFAGVAVLVLARGPNAFSPLAMGLTFGVGQLAGAAVLRFTLERRGDDA